MQIFSLFSVNSVSACSGRINVCGNVGEYICEANENCPCGSRMTFIDVCFGNMEIEYEACSMDCGYA